ncbi:MAG TPA: ABC transporter ATP-binding protein [Candidatus Paceibacterota bacterium]
MKPLSFPGLVATYKWLFAAVVILTFVANGLYVYIPRLSASVIDQANAASGLAGAYPALITLAVVAVVALVSTSVQVFVSGYFSEKVALDLRNKVIDKLGDQSFGYISKAGSGKLLTNATSDVEAVKNVLSQGLSTLLGALIVLVGTIVLLLSINWRLGLIVLAVIPLLLLTMFLVFSKLGAFFNKAQQNLESINSLVNETIVGSALIRVLGSGGSENKKFSVVNGISRDVGFSIIKYISALIPVITLLSNISVMLIIWFGGLQVIGGGLTIGEFSAFMSYSALFVWPLFVLAFVGTSISRGGISLGRINEVLMAPIEEGTGTVTDEVKGDIEFKNVSLAYKDESGTEKTVVKDVSFSIRAGTKTAIVGPTAGGKTQIFYLLTGLVDPTQGSVFVDGKNLNEYNKESFLSHVGLVFQDSLMFNTTFRENIALSGEVNEEVLAKAIKAAELEDLVKKLPKGLDTLVSERGTSLSGGQKQRIMLARALARNPKVLLLDDFTARVDQATESLILGNVKSMYPDTTLISITQKINLITDYDSIIVVMEGEMLAQGTHEELLKNSFEYRQMFESQQTAH